MDFSDAKQRKKLEALKQCALFLSIIWFINNYWQALPVSWHTAGIPHTSLPSVKCSCLNSLFLAVRISRSYILPFFAILHPVRTFPFSSTEKNRVYYEYYNLGTTENVPEDYTEISFVCLRENGCLELPATVETACRTAAGKVPELEGFHFHTFPPHLYDEPVIKRGTAQRRTGTFRTLRRKHYHECLCTRYKGG